LGVIMLSGPIGAGKTTVGRELIALLPPPVSYIEGDKFWSFVAVGEGRSRREHFRVIMRAMTAAAVPFARSGYEVVIDFSIPPDFLDTARKILKEAPVDYVVVRPSLAVCEARALARVEGRILNYSVYRDLYALFEEPARYAVCDDHADALSLARRIREGLTAGVFRVP
jgi:adenylylsulfate kinase-like enzyme